MRYQERIYIQDQISSVRNRAINNFNMSSDMCVFETPLFNVSGGTKIDCTSGGTITGATYIVSANTQTIPLTFDFTANTQTFLDSEANFRYEIYKYDNNGGIFSAIPTYKSDVFSYSVFSATNSIAQYVPTSGLTLDGEYLVKGYYQYSACTNFLKLLGKKIDTVNYKYGSEYNIYDKNLDYYFIGVNQAETPQLIANGSNTPAAGILNQSTYLPVAGESYIVKPAGLLSSFIVTLNGLVLSNLYDYTVSGETIQLAGLTAEDDIITFIYTSQGGRAFTSDNIDINVPITSGATNGQGSNLIYFNTTTNKYEVYTTVTPQQGGSIILMLNGVTLANNIDFYQSTTNPKRLILEGDLLIGDIITLVYFPQNDVINGLNVNYPTVTWKIQTTPQKNNGYFSLQVSTATTFNTLYYSGYTLYDTNGLVYSDTFTASGTVGTNLYYRVKNEKNYETICGKIITTIAYSDVVPVTILSNLINSY